MAGEIMRFRKSRDGDEAVVRRKDDEETLLTRDYLEVQAYALTSHVPGSLAHRVPGDTERKEDTWNPSR